MGSQQKFKGYGFFEENLYDEMEAAIRKHTIDRTPVNPGMPNVDKLVILVEEIGEVARAMTYDEGNLEDLKSELVQVAAMAGMWWMSLSKADR